MDSDSPENAAVFDPSKRKLCPDGSCVGVIGDDGRCRECGRTEAEAEAGTERVSAPDAGPDDVGGSEPGGGADTAGGDAGAGDFDSRRRLCDDGSCVGVVGDDGACRVCGRRAQ